MEQIDNLKELINQGDVDTAIEQLDQLLQDTSVEKEKDTLYYLRGNAYRKKGDWKPPPLLRILHSSLSLQRCSLTSSTHNHKLSIGEERAQTIHRKRQTLFVN